MFVCCWGAKSGQECRVQSSKKRYKCCSLLNQGFTTHTEKEKPSKGNITDLQHKKRSGHSEIDHISLKGKNEKVALTSNEPDPDWYIDLISSTPTPLPPTPKRLHYWQGWSEREMLVKLRLSSLDHMGQHRWWNSLCCFIIWYKYNKHHILVEPT